MERVVHGTFETHVNFATLVHIRAYLALAICCRDDTLLLNLVKLGWQGSYKRRVPFLEFDEHRVGPGDQYEHNRDDPQRDPPHTIAVEKKTPSTGR